MFYIDFDFYNQKYLMQILLFIYLYNKIILKLLIPGILGHKFDGKLSKIRKCNRECVGEEYWACERSENYELCLGECLSRIV